jgi:thioredoxin reductase
LVLGEVQAIDLDARRLTVDTVGVRSEVAYDSLILAAGAQQSYLGRPDFGWDAPGMKTIDDALELRGRIFGAFEMAEREPDPSLRQIWRTFVVVGAGPTGVELAGQIAELTRRSLHRNFRRIDPAQSPIVLLDAAPTILGAFPESLQRRAARDLERLGVELHLGARVTGVDARGIDTDSFEPGVRRIEAVTKIWAAGVEASPLARVVAEAAGARTDRAGRVHVRPDCTLPGHPEVFVIGDSMRLEECPASPRWRSSPAAMPPRRSRAGCAATPPSGRSATATRERWRRSPIRARSRASDPYGPGGSSPVAAVDRRPSVRADRLQEPRGRPVGLDGRIHRPGSAAAHDDDPAGLRATGARGPGGGGQRRRGGLPRYGASSGAASASAITR